MRSSAYIRPGAPVGERGDRYRYRLLPVKTSECDGDADLSTCCGFKDISYDKTEINVPMDDGIFKMPGAEKPAIKK